MVVTQVTQRHLLPATQQHEACPAHVLELEQVVAAEAEAGAVAVDVPCVAAQGGDLVQGVVGAQGQRGPSPSVVTASRFSLRRSSQVVWQLALELHRPHPSRHGQVQAGAQHGGRGLHGLAM